VSAYASLVGNRTVNDSTAVNATQAILQGARRLDALPLVAWVAFASVLNVAIWRLS
jgi:tryptophan-rich sensory protein